MFCTEGKVPTQNFFEVCSHVSRPKHDNNVNFHKNFHKKYAGKERF